MVTIWVAFNVNIFFSAKESSTLSEYLTNINTQRKTTQVFYSLLLAISQVTKVFIFAFIDFGVGRNNKLQFRQLSRCTRLGNTISFTGVTSTTARKQKWNPTAALVHRTCFDKVYTPFRLPLLFSSIFFNLSWLQLLSSKRKRELSCTRTDPGLRLWRIDYSFFIHSTAMVI